MLTEVGGVRSPSPSPHRQTQAARAFGGQLQPSGRDETEAGGLGHDGGQTGMTKAFLETGEKGRLVPGLDIDHPVRTKARLLETGGEEIGLRHAPEDLSGKPRGNPGCKAGCGGAIHCAIAAACHLVEAAERQPAPG